MAGRPVAARPVSRWTRWAIRLGSLVATLAWLSLWACAASWLAVPAAQARAARACHVEHEAVRVSGRLAFSTFAGSPGYDSARRGDRAERVPVLHLSAPLCVADSAVAMQGQRGGRQVRRVQVLDLDEQLRGALLADCLKACTLSGELFLAESGHHHLPVLLELSADAGAAQSSSRITHKAVRTSR